MIAPGTCRHCGCTDGNRCALFNGDECVFIDRTRLVCSNPMCVKAEEARKLTARKQEPSYRGWGYGAIVQDLRRKDRSRNKREKRKGGER